MQQKILFSRGIDSDTSPEMMPEGVGRWRLNVRVMESDGGEDQSAESVKGNTLVSFALPLGTNTVIGSKEDPLQKKSYYFIYNTSNLHSILEFNHVTNAIAKVFQDGVVGNPANILNFDIDHLITGINIVELTATSHLLYWTDNFNEPRKINIDKGKLFMLGAYSFGYKFPFDPLILNRIKQPPLTCPDYTWESPANTLQFKAHEIAFQAQITAALNIIGYDALDSGSGFNTGTYTWTVPAAGVYDIKTTTYLASNSGVNDYDIYIKNNGVTFATVNPVNTIGGNYDFDVNNVPLSAGDLITVWIINNYLPFGVPVDMPIRGVNFEASSIGLATKPSINHLFKKAFQFKTQFVYDDFEVSSWSPISKFYFPETIKDSVQIDDIIFQDSIITLTVQTGSSIVKKIRISGREENSSDFVLIAELDKDNLAIGDNTTYNFTFLNDGLYIPLEINESIKLFDSVPKKSQSQDIIFTNRIVDGLITEGYDNVDIDMKMPVSYGVVTSSAINDHFPLKSYLKSGGTYNYGIVYYDEAGNRSGVTNINEGASTDVQLNGNFGTKLSIPFLTESDYAPAAGVDLMSRVPIINTEIYNRPPSWAYKYQILRSKNLSIRKYIQFSAKSISYSGGVISITILNIYTDYKTKYPNSTLVYDFTKGDRIRFIAPRASGTTIGTPFFFNDSEIIKFDLTTGIVTIKDNFSAPSGMTIGALFEIYTPSAEFVLNDELVYETCDQGSILTDIHGNKVHSGDESSILNKQLIVTYTTSTYVGTTFTGLGIATGHGLLVNDKVKVASVGSGYSVYGVVTSVLSNSVVVTTNTTLTGTFSGILTGTISKAATLELSSGDCFRRVQDNYYTSASLVHYVEASNVSNMFVSNAWDYGRPNRIDPNYREVTRPSTVIYSEQLVPETFINGLSTVYDTSFQTYENKYGGIYKLYAKDQTLTVFQELKVGGILVKQVLFNGTNGGSVVGASSQILPDTMQYYVGEFGIGKHPESFAIFGSSKYFIDVQRGVVLRLSNDGITPISDLYQMHDYFNSKCKAVLAYGSKVNIYGVYDINFKEYIISFQNKSGFTGETLAFNEEDNAWSTFYSYLPDYMDSNGVNMISFKNGALYTHNTNSLYNNFYGVQYKSNLWAYCNFAPSNKKVFEAISLESTEAWDVTIETPVTNENPLGQTTSLITNNFQMKEGFFYSEILMDDNTPNVANPRFEGNPMRGQYALIKLQYPGTDYVKIFACNVLIIPSQRSNQ